MMKQYTVAIIRINGCRCKRCSEYVTLMVRILSRYHVFWINSATITINTLTMAIADAPQDQAVDAEVINVGSIGLCRR